MYTRDATCSCGRLVTTNRCATDQVLPFLSFDHAGRRTDSLVVVVSPLVSLMVDQVHVLRQKGFKAAIMSTLSKFGKNSAALEIDLKDSKSLFCAPEAIQRDRWRDAFEQPELAETVVAVVVDEAHCVYKWYIYINNYNTTCTQHA